MKQPHGKEMLVLVLDTHDSRWILDYILGCINLASWAHQNRKVWVERSHRICIAVAVEFLKTKRGVDLYQY